jgi:hypothetical protein
MHSGASTVQCACHRCGLDQMLHHTTVSLLMLKCFLYNCINSLLVMRIMMRTLHCAWHVGWSLQ